jgi:hypothetical protein
MHFEGSELIWESAIRVYSQPCLRRTECRDPIPNKGSVMETRKGSSEIRPGRPSCEGRIILLTTDLTLSAEENHSALQFAFQDRTDTQTSGAFRRILWLSFLDGGDEAHQTEKRRNGNQYLHRTSERYRNQVARKMRAYHVFVQTGMIAQGMLQYLSMTRDELVWQHFGSWIRTIRPDVLPSEMVVSEALKNTLAEFLHRSVIAAPFRKFILDRIDFTRADGERFAA